MNFPLYALGPKTGKGTHPPCYRTEPSSEGRLPFSTMTISGGVASIWNSHTIRPKQRAKSAKFDIAAQPVCRRQSVILGPCRRVPLIAANTERRLHGNEQRSSKQVGVWGKERKKEKESTTADAYNIPWSASESYWRKKFNVKMKFDSFKIN